MTPSDTFIGEGLQPGGVKALEDMGLGGKATTCISIDIDVYSSDS